jgi:hypothetical protein
MIMGCCKKCGDYRMVNSFGYCIHCYVEVKQLKVIPLQVSKNEWTKAELYAEEGYDGPFLDPEDISPEHGQVHIVKREGGTILGVYHDPNVAHNKAAEHLAIVESWSVI